MYGAWTVSQFQNHVTVLQILCSIEVTVFLFKQNPTSYLFNTFLSSIRSWISTVQLAKLAKPSARKSFTMRNFNAFQDLTAKMSDSGDFFVGTSLPWGSWGRVGLQGPWLRGLTLIGSLY